MRLAGGLTVVGAVLLMSGVVMVLVGEAQRLKSPGGLRALISAGEIMAALGLGFGMTAMVVVIAGTSRLRRPQRRAAQRGHDEWARAARAAGTRARVARAAGARARAAQAIGGPGRDARGLGHRGHDVAAEEWLSPFR
jgi:hypothetical protein